MFVQVEISKVEELLEVLIEEKYKGRIIITKAISKEYYGTLVAPPANA
ncbi:MAG: hypothetical protein HY280_06210 [Nitrospinae bacterium]|nr:hypothetical protein [Nitrospinota bacterium]